MAGVELPSGCLRPGGVSEEDREVVLVVVVGLVGRSFCRWHRGHRPATVPPWSARAKQGGRERRGKRVLGRLVRLGRAEKEGGREGRRASGPRARACLVGPNKGRRRGSRSVLPILFFFFKNMK
jgi:hypothetical protein